MACRDFIARRSLCVCFRFVSLSGMDYFRVARNPSRTDVKRGDHFLQADFPGLIRAIPNWITSESPTIHELSLIARWCSCGDHNIHDQTVGIVPPSMM